ncbi:MULTISPECIES: PH domain-containing protein [unclassified Colwellia]|uniref:PH domain-containing protein n=1 Tax=unclassified Colwellia TaxID=196834 RepID=UPI0015F4E4CC|nr:MULTISPECIES: PH domain-containing protein [unclassified Colwellia]MBA6254409.1 PH domain-containing protein [Colwellia sp. MB3u-28]MBA6259214.1 PH domain-containing protein [Colwellia sp. MB3u-41]
MGSYVISNLIKDEEVVYEGKTSVWSLLPKILIGLLLLPVYGIGLIFWASAAIAYYTTELAITNKRVIAKFGLIRRDTVEMNISKVESIQVEQGIIGRIFNFGSIVVAGAGDPKAPIPGISTPLEFRKMFFEAQEQNDSNTNNQSKAA